MYFILVQGWQKLPGYEVKHVTYQTFVIILSNVEIPSVYDLPFKYTRCTQFREWKPKLSRHCLYSFHYIVNNKMKFILAVLLDGTKFACDKDTAD